jgi:hypothetical protein
MNDHRKTITGSFLYHESAGRDHSASQGAVPVAEHNWFRKLMLLPVFAVAGILGIFFFTAFMVLFALLIAGFGVRLWWLRRQLRQSMAASGSLYREETIHSTPENMEVVEGEYVVLTTEHNAGADDSSTSAPDDASNRVRSQPGKQDV